MDDMNPASKPAQGSELEVYKDAFALPRPTRHAKPWDRELVASHAPRLHGQKIWKKSGSIIRGTRIRETGDAQKELDLEGMGARKRLRIAGAKENISNAKWMPEHGDNQENELGNMERLSPVKKAGQVLDLDALLVPRKRTNANHLITPKKSTKKVPLQDVTPGAGNIISDKEVEFESSKSLSPIAKPARRTKSLRNSFRRLSSFGEAEEISNGQSKTVGPHLEFETSESLHNVSLIPLSLQPVDIFCTSADTVPGAHANVEVVQVDAEQSVSSNEEPAKRENLDEGEIEELPKAAEPSELLTILEESSETLSLVCNNLEENSLVTFSLETSLESKALLSTRVGETPKNHKSRNSRTPMRSPVKRSARLARANSLALEDMPSKAIQNCSTIGEPPSEAHSPYRAQHTPKSPSSKIIALVPVESGHHDQNAEGNFTTPKENVGVAAVSISVSLIDQDASANEVVTERNEMEDIQEALNIEATESFDFDLPPPMPSTVYDDVMAVPALESTDEFDLAAPELPTHDLERTAPQSPIVSPSCDKVPEDFESLETLDEIAFSIEPAGEASTSQNDHVIDNPSAVLELAEEVSATVYNRDDTDLLRNFLNRVKASKVAKANILIPKRKRSLPHSPLQIPLGTLPLVSSPSSPKAQDETVEFDITLPTISPSKRKKVGDRTEDEDELAQPRKTRRSGRTRLPVKSAPFAAPSFIPLRRLNGQDGDTTVTLRKNEDKELATLTKFNTRKNKGGALLPPLVLAKKAEEKEDPAAKHKALKEVFDENAAAKKAKNKKGRNVVWAEEIAQYQTATPLVELEPMLLPVKEDKKVKAKQEDQKPVKVGMRSKIALGMATNGTPAPKRQLKPRQKRE